MGVGTTIGWLGLVSIAGVLACGSDRGSGPPRGVGGTAGNAGSAGQAGSAGSICEGSRVEGTVDGSAIDVVLPFGAAADSGFLDDRWRHNQLFDEGAVLSLSGLLSAKPSDGTPLTGIGYFATPPSSKLAGMHVTATQASATYLEWSAPVVLEGLSLVGGCPGAPLAGSLDVCSSSLATDCTGFDVRISGTLDGAAFEQGYDKAGSFYLSGPMTIVHTTMSPDGHIWLHDWDSGTPAGYLVFPAGSTRAGQVICIGEATITHGEEFLELELSSLSLAGTLPGEAVSGSLTITGCAD